MTRARDKASAVVANFASTGIDDNADATAITINSSEQVGIGTSSPSSMLSVVNNQAAHTSVDIFNNSGSSSARGQLRVGYDATACLEIFRVGNVADITLNTPQSGSIIFQGGGNEMMRMSTAGLAIGGTGSANTLDDYEEGTWSPASGTITLSSSAGKYTKIGNLVSISWLIEFPSNSDASNSAIVGGLPFNVAATQFSGTTAITNFGSTNILPMVNHADNTITFRTYSNTTYANANMSSKFHYGWAVYTT
tara:strand:+ start:3577 stop:4329 length:753 start_codon:yes stop_codon:yes gene_type:complete